ncbi:hypothetical protein M408DRAFT_163809 [Serendipita vermifera MAFF 305830]|uniref:DUF6535 domain-containing protein n=1 Tax=Serendipita vermifera MAFF 305830 TaxID=933852 RepID=A0A0C3AT36_SERVB|nr:hypothetical protein M408DRAFT_163809 [Serendipita vermifera MAFF 305830]
MSDTASMANAPDLEKGKIDPHIVSSPETVVDQEGQPNGTLSRSPPPVTDRKLEGDGEAPCASHCRADADIWRLYLKETEAEDREVTELWNSSLDSLLVFAGLFAGILTAFLIESRRSLNEDPQESLLREILGAIRNMPASPNTQQFQPSPSSIHVNGLWFSSLALTLISALGGVLAKGWLAKYNPASLRERSTDACERHLRAIRARQWQLEPFITGIPLLIQISLFLFFAGLIIQLLDDDIRIWVTVVILVGATVLSYIVGTLLPWFSPACPFQTPISSLFGGGTVQGKYKDVPNGHSDPEEPAPTWGKWFLTLWGRSRLFVEEVRTKPEQLLLQAQILSWVITNSTNEATIAEAIRAVGGSKPTQELQKELTQTKARESLYQRLQYSVKLTPGLPKLVNNGPQVEDLLYALLRTEQPLNIDDGPVQNPAVTSLLEEGQALRRWDDFKPFLQTLAFSLRVHMLVNRNQDDHDENWSQTTENLGRMAEAGSTPYIRSILFFATLRGLLKGKSILRKTCGIILSKQIVIGKRDYHWFSSILTIPFSGCAGKDLRP